MANVFYIKWCVLQQCCNNRMKELCCICCTFSLPFLMSVFVCSHHILYMWLLGLHHTAACQVIQIFDICVCVCVCVCVCAYMRARTHRERERERERVCVCQRLFLPFLSPILTNFSRWKMFPHKLSNWVYWKYSAAESGHCDGNRLRWHCELQHLLSSQAVDMIHSYVTKS
jgi:hypothetical protein